MRLVSGASLELGAWILEFLLRTPARLLPLVLLSLGLPCALAQPTLTAISPDWIQRGATLEVTLTGAGFGSVTGLVFSGEAGLSGTIVSDETSPLLSIEGAPGISVAPAVNNRDKSLRARLTVATNASLTARELRVVGPSGISAPVNITVGTLPQIAEAGGNHGVGTAQRVTLPAVIAGNIAAPTETDHFRFAAKKGEQLVLEIVAQRNGSSLDSSLAVLDAAGKELARNEDARGFDSLLAFTAPADGEYVAQLRDFQYRGGAGFSYRLFISATPHVDYVFPFGGQRGKAVEVTMSGRNLGAEKLTLNLAPDAPLGRQEIRLSTPRGFSNPIQFDVQDLAESVEKEPNDAGTNVNAVAPPVLINGQIGAAKDEDRFRFKVASDQKLVCAIEARRFGSPLDAHLALFAGEQLLAQNDDASGPDARLEFDAKKDTEYTVVVRDLTGRGGAQFSYRLAIRPASAASATFAAKYFPDAVRLHRGGRTHVRVEVARQGYNGPVRVTAASLPMGVSAEPIVIPAGRNEGDLLISASSEAAGGTQPFTVVASATIGDKEVRLPATPIAPSGATERVFRGGFLTVLGPAPFTVEGLSLAAAVDQLQSGSIDVLVNRASGFAGEVKLSAIGFSAGREPITKSLDAKEVVAKAGETTAKIPFTAKVDAEVGTRVVLVRGEATHEGQKVVQFSPPVAVTVAPIPFVLIAAPAKAALNGQLPGSTNVDEAVIKLLVNRRGFGGEIPLTFSGLPAGVRAEGTNVPAGAGELPLKFLCTAEAKPGTNYSVTVKGAAMHNDRLFRHQTAIKVTISPPAAVEVAATNAAVVPKQP
jgi:hypothetical protein